MLDRMVTEALDDVVDQSGRRGRPRPAPGVVGTPVRNLDTIEPFNRSGKRRVHHGDPLPGRAQLLPEGRQREAIREHPILDVVAPGLRALKREHPMGGGQRAGQEGRPDAALEHTLRCGDGRDQSRLQKASKGRKVPLIRPLPHEADVPGVNCHKNQPVPPALHSLLTFGHRDSLPLSFHSNSLGEASGQLSLR